MIELDRHIEILLLENDCVIVPDLGGFMAHYCEARYDDSDQIFLPPQRTLGFNPQLKINDSLLAQSYVEAYDISYPEAVRRIEGEVGELWQHLHNEGSYELNDIGRLTINDEGHLLFEPCEAGILTPELYGLSTFEAIPLAGKNTVTKTADTTSTHDETETEETTGRSEALTIPLAWVRNAIAIAAAILAFFLIATPVDNTSYSGVSMSQVNLPLMTKDSNAKVDTKLDRKTIRKTVARKDTTIATTAAAPKEQTEETAATAEKAKPAPAYCIVLASQVSERNAKEFIGQLQTKGVDARIYMHNNVRRVVCGNYITEAEAYKALNDVNRQSGLTEAWVYKLRN
ncbi:MAG: SPOR domain-containing protein [Prevotella sp.]|nr:SPOR domain-containing protein [Prevotella sp.]